MPQSETSPAKPEIVKKAFFNKKDIQSVIDKVGAFLAAKNRAFLKDASAYILRELLTNANKSNIKTNYIKTTNAE